MQIIPRTG